MTLSRPVKIVVGALTLVPLVHIVVFMTTFLFIFLRISQMRPGTSSEEFGQGVEQWFFLLMALHFAMILVAWALIAFYLVFLFKTDRVPKDKKALWAVVLFMAGLIAMPVFFWLYIWPENDALAVADSLSAPPAPRASAGPP